MCPRTDWQQTSGGWEEADWIIDQLTPWCLEDEANSILDYERPLLITIVLREGGQGEGGREGRGEEGERAGGGREGRGREGGKGKGSDKGRKEREREKEKT